MKLPYRILLSCILLLILLPAGRALAKKRDSSDSVVRGSLGIKLDAAVTRAGGVDFWGSVLVARDGEIVLSKGYGQADYQGRPNTPRTLFELASVSKQITAAAVLHLQQRKKLSVTDTVDRFFDRVPEDKEDIQVHHLLTHTSGISPRLGVPYASTLGRDAYIRQMLSEPLCSAPGETYAYCNVGYAVLAAIVEVASKRTFEDYVERYLFKPAKMKDSGFIGDRDLVKSERVSVRRSKEARRWTAADWHWGWGYRGMGGVVTTTLDMFRWDQALRGTKVLDERQQALLVTPYKDGYAYGWQAGLTERGTQRAWHTGNVEGYGTTIVRYLEDDAFVVVLSNDPKAAYEVTDAVERLLFEPPEIHAEIDLAPYTPGADRTVALPAKRIWKNVRDRHELVLRLLDKRHTILEIRAPKTCARKLIRELEQAIAAREADDEGGKAAWDASLHLRAYNPSDRKVRLRESVSVEIRSEYRVEGPSGRPVVDRRVFFLLDDRKNGGWPVRVMMNIAGARKLLEVLKKAAR